MTQYTVSLIAVALVLCFDAAIIGWFFVPEVSRGIPTDAEIDAALLRNKLLKIARRFSLMEFG
jgi:hypothetical protein